MDYRFAELADVPSLAEASMQFLIDTGAPVRPHPAELEKLWTERLGTEDRAVIFDVDGRPAAYALYRPEGDVIRLEQFWVRREKRGRGIGRSAFLLLREEILAPGLRIQVEAPSGSTGAIAFFRSMGFTDHAVTLQARTSATSSEAAAETSTEQSA